MALFKGAHGGRGKKRGRGAPPPTSPHVPPPRAGSLGYSAIMSPAIEFLLNKGQITKSSLSTSHQRARTPTFPSWSPKQPDAQGGYPDPWSPKHNHSKTGWGCLGVNSQGTLIRNIWPPKRVDTAQAGGQGWICGWDPELQRLNEKHNWKIPACADGAHKLHGGI